MLQSLGHLRVMCEFYKGEYFLLDWKQVSIPSPAQASTANPMTILFASYWYLLTIEYPLRDLATWTTPNTLSPQRIHLFVKPGHYSKIFSGILDAGMIERLPLGEDTVTSSLACVKSSMNPNASYGVGNVPTYTLTRKPVLSSYPRPTSSPLFVSPLASASTWSVAIYLNSSTCYGLHVSSSPSS